MASVDLRELRKTYAGGFEAVQGVSLAIPDGALCVLVGPSGCGKSTLLRMVAGLETVTAGDVLIEDRRVNDIGPAERDIAMVFQTYALYPHMSVFDNMAYGLRNRRVPKDEIERRVREAAETLELAALLERRPRELSGGQRQRVAMGRAIVRNPKAFLFDEPLSNLDAKLRGHMRVEIRRLQKRLGVTSIYVTHDQLEAMTLADLLVVMNNGKVEQAGTPIEIYDRPASTFVAGFIGAPPMNLLPLRDGRMADGSPLALGLPDRPQFGTLGFRPEEVFIGSEEGSALLSLSPFRVEAVEVVGAESYIYGQVSGCNATLRVAGRAAAAPGNELPLRLPLEKAHLFDEGGLRANGMP